jgi:hypothetical protein
VGGTLPCSSLGQFSLRVRTFREIQAWSGSNIRQDSHLVIPKTDDFLGRQKLLFLAVIIGAALSQPTGYRTSMGAVAPRHSLSKGEK